MRKKNPVRVRLVIELAICAGALSLVMTAFSVALWADWLIEISEHSASGVSADILGRQLEMFSLGTITIATSLVANMIRTRKGEVHVLAASLGTLSATLIGTLVGLHWERGFYDHLEHSGALASFVLALVQAFALMGTAGVENESTAE
jgi:hypothetical protein